MSVGDRLLASVALVPRRAAEGCSYALRVENGRWSLTGGLTQLSLAGELGFMPDVNGLFSELDLQTVRSLAVTVVTLPHRTDATALQSIARLAAAIGALGALALVAAGHAPKRTRRSARALFRHVGRGIRWIDAAVLLVLSGWWILAPAHWDDGWVVARQSSFTSAGGFSNYYDSFGSNLPNGYWIEWAQHWLTQSSNAILVLRLPALLSLAATWVIARWALSRILEDTSGSKIVRWALATTFLAGAMAWGMTLRPEPFTALLVTLVFACAVAFSLGESAAVLALAVALIPLAITGHHAGLLAAAPLFAIGSRLVPWIRRNPAAATALITSAFALLLLLAFMGADVGQRSLEAQALRSYGVPDAWFDELRRYARLSDFHGGPPLRRGAVALIALTVLAFLVRRMRTTRGLLDLPATTLVVGLILLIAVPSKWPWHFGALMGIAAIAAAIETHRISSDDARPRGWRARWLLAVVATAVAIAWSWGPRESWTLFDVSTLGWTPDRAVSLSVLAAGLPLLLLCAVILASRLHGRAPSDAPWRIASYAAPIVVVPMIVFTVAILATDAARSEWTLAKQSLGLIRGGAGCGLADILLVPEQGSIRSVPVVSESSLPSRAEWVPPTPVQGLQRYSLGPSRSESVSSPWFDLSGAQRVGLFLAGSQRISDKLELEWGSVRGERIDERGRSRLSADPAVSSAGITPWRFLTASELPRQPQGANAVRITFRADPASGSALAVTAPVTYRNATLSRSLTNRGVTALVSPAFRMYMPCAALPALGGGLAGTPLYIVSPSGVWTPDPDIPVGYRTSPFRGITDLYDVERVSTTDSNTDALLAVWRVDTRISGGTLLRPTQREVGR